MEHNTKILLVEDDKSFSLMVQTYLGVYYNIDVANNLKLAKKKLLEQEYQIFILDKSLDDGNGSQLIPFIKERFPISSIIMLTADKEFNSVFKSLTSGADDYIVKSESCLQELMVRIPLAINNLTLKIGVSQKPNLVSLNLPLNQEELSLENYKNFVQKAEKKYIDQALKLMGNNVAKTALKLGLSRATVFNKIKSENDKQTLNPTHELSY